MIPISTDAPIYHYPVVSIGLIVVNVIVFAMTGAGMDPELIEPWALSHGQGLHPVQWVTSNFIHGGFGHLIGNMIFLWGFGLVVEGKLGWWKYLLVYLGIGVAQCALEQTCMLGHDPVVTLQERLAEAGFDIEQQKQEYADGLREDGHSEEEIAEALSDFDAEFESESLELIIASGPSMSFGASSILYGLLAICLVWAPKNEVTVLVIILYRAATFEVTIMTFACWYIGLEILTASFSGFSMGSATLHAMGAVIGFGVGVALFKMKLVDCEDWDLFAVMSGHYGPWARDRHGYPIERDAKNVEMNFEEPGKKEEPKKKKKKAPSKAARNRKLDDIAGFVEAGDFMRAVDELHNHRLRDPAAIPDEETMKKLAIGLAREGLWDDAVPVMEEFIETYSDSANGMRLRLANVFLKQNSSASARTVLREVDQTELSAGQRRTFKQLAKAARG